MVFDPSGVGRSVCVFFSFRAKVSDLVDALREFVDIAAEIEDLALIDPRSQARFDNDALVADCPFFHGERVVIREQAQDENIPLLPSLSYSDLFRIEVEIGPQLGLVWGIGAETSLGFRVEQSTGLLFDDKDNPSLLIEFSEVSGQIEAFAPEQQILIDGEPSTASPTPLYPGSSIEIVSEGEEKDTLALLRVHAVRTHERNRSIDATIPYRVVPAPSDIATGTERGPVQLEAIPDGKVEPVNLVELLLQQIPALLMPLLFIFSIGLKPYVFVFFLLPVAPVIYAYYRKSKEKDKIGRRIGEWNQTTNHQIGEVRAAAINEAAALDERHPDILMLSSLAIHGREGLWQENYSSQGLIQVGVGRGEYVTPTHAELPGSLTDTNLQDWRAFIEKMRVVEDARHVMSLDSSGLAVVGSGERVAQVLGEIVLRLSLTCSPRTLPMRALLPSMGPDLERLNWLRWIPHYSTPSDLFPDLGFVRGAEDADAAVRHALEDLPEAGGRIILLIHEGTGADSSLIEHYIEEGAGRIIPLWFGHTANRVPGFFSRTLQLDPELTDNLLVGSVLPSGRPVVVTPVGLDQFELVASQLAPLVDEGTAGRESLVPLEAPLGSMLDVEPDQLGQSILDRWNSSSSAESLRIPIGLTGRGTFEFDLFTDGPHALVGGTTGSGKSEFLRSAILAMATTYSPTQLALMLIDFKGGAALSDFEGLPHQVGVVSNLEPSDVVRVIEFLREEINRRQRILRPYQGEYPRYREAALLDGRQKTLPRLVVVVDEFAGFLGNSQHNSEAIINIAARGRSLGVHLVLATQRPGTGIPKEVTANVDARFCLRTLDGTDSAAVIDSEDAASILKSTPGRVYARLAAGVIEEFQSAFAEDQSLYRRRDSPIIRLETFEPVSGPPPVDKTEDRKKNSLTTDARLLLDGIAVAAEAGEFTLSKRRLDERGILWAPQADQPVLAPALAADLGAAAGSSDLPVGRYVVGRRDEPQHQRQSDEVVDLGLGAILVTGSTLSGRTEILTVLAGEFRSKGEGRLVVVDNGGGKLAERLGPVADFTLVNPARGELEFLFEQLDLPEFRGDSEKVLVLFDRIDAIELTAPELERTAGFLINGPGRGIYYALTADSRAQLEVALTRACYWRYAGVGLVPGRFATRTEELVQFYRARIPGALAQPARRPLGLADPTLGLDEVEDPGNVIFVGVDEIRHARVLTSLRRGLAIVGRDGSGRSTAILSLGERLSERLGRRVPVISEVEVSRSLFIDVRAELRELGRDHGDWSDLVDNLWLPNEPNFILIDDAQRFGSVGADVGGVSLFPFAVQSSMRQNRVRVIATGEPDMLIGAGVQDIPGMPHYGDQSFLVLQPMSAREVDRFGLGLHWDVIVRPRSWRDYQPGEGILLTAGTRYDVRVVGTARAEEQLRVSRRGGNDL